MPTTQLAKWGNSLVVRIPKRIAQDAALHAGDAVSLSIASEGGLLIQPARCKRQIVSRITVSNQHKYTDWGSPQGKELW